MKGKYIYIYIYRHFEKRMIRSTYLKASVKSPVKYGIEAWIPSDRESSSKL
jgi:hypothetical protein